VDFWTRDNPAVTPEYLIYNKDTYILTGKLLNAETNISEDGLTLTTMLIWDSQASSDAWRNDPIVQEQFVQVMKSYHAANGITVVRTEEEI
jgi:hypothetical protein